MILWENILFEKEKVVIAYLETEQIIAQGLVSNIPTIVLWLETKGENQIFDVMYDCKREAIKSLKELRELLK